MQLNKYDKFYRVVADPFINLHCEDFIEDLNKLIESAEKEYEENHPTYRFDLELMPYVKFLEHYKAKKEWEKYITNVESPFMRLL